MDLPKLDYEQLEKTEGFDPFVWYNKGDIDLSTLKDGDLFRLIDECDFDVHEQYGVYHLVDREGGNLGDIESEMFSSLIDICERLEGTYFNDYFGDENA